MNADEKALLKKHETTIKSGLQTFHNVGMAFAEIRDRGLYREHGTFDNYCQKVWNVSRSKAYRYMAAAECVENLVCSHVATNEPIAIPTTEKHARKLAKLKKDEQVEVAKKVAKKTTKPTAKDFDEEVDKLRDDEEKPRVKVYDISEESAEEEPVVITAVPKVDKTLVPMAQIANKIKDIYNIYCNSGKKQDGLNMFGELQRWVASWVKWEAEQKEVV